MATRRMTWHDKAGNKMFETRYSDGHVRYEVKNKHGKTVNPKDAMRLIRKVTGFKIKTLGKRKHRIQKIRLYSQRRSYTPFNLFG
jgi:hypothetical protein